MEEKIIKKLETIMDFKTNKKSLTKYEYEYLLANPELLDKYLDKTVEVDYDNRGFLITNFGTFVFTNSDSFRIKREKVNFKKILTIFEFFDFIGDDRLSYLKFKENYDKSIKEGTPVYEMKEKIIKIKKLKRVLDIFESMNIEKINELHRKNELYFEIKDSCCEYPIEAFNNPNFNIKLKTRSDYELIKKYMELGFDFKNNTKLMLDYIVYYDLSNEFLEYVKNNYEEFINLIIKNKYNCRVIDKELYLKYLFKYFEVEYDLLLEIYINDPLVYEKYPIFKKVTNKVENKSPIVILDESGKEVNIRYNDYDMYDGIPIKKIKILNKFPRNKFENNFIICNDAIFKLYKKYYKKYLEHTPNGNLKSFVYNMLFNFNNFKKIIEDDYFTVNDIKDFCSFRYCYPASKTKEFEINYENYKKERLQFYFDIYNEFVQSKDDKDKIIEILRKLGWKKEIVYSKLLKNKHISATMKTSIIEILSKHFEIHIKIIDLIDIFEESVNRNEVLDSLLREKNIDKKTFWLFYDKVFEENPILNDYKEEVLSKEEMSFNRKNILLGYKILNSNINSYSEYKDLNPNVDIIELINSLIKTELHDKLISKINEWEDSPFNQNKKLNLKKVDK